MCPSDSSLDGSSTVLVNVPILNNISNGYFPIGLAYVASSLMEHGVRIDALDPQGESLGEEETLERIESLIKDRGHRFFGVSSMVTGYGHVKRLARNIKRLREDAVVYVGGSISTAADLLLEKTEVDIVCFGEGEYTAPELLATLSNGGDLSEVPGIAFEQDGEIRRTPERGRIDDLGNLSFPAWDLFPMESYITTPKIVQGPARSMTLVATRGCPFRCGFCYRNFGRLVRCRPPEDVVRELQTIVERFGVTHVEFVDELFTQNPNHTIELCTAIRDSGIEVTWRALSRVHPVSREMFQVMKEAGCRWIGFGLESGSQTVLNAMMKAVKVEQQKNAIRLARSVGLHVSGTFIIGYPGETEETIEESIRFCEEMELSNSPFFPIPFPGTFLYDRLKLENRIGDEEAFIETISGNASDLLINLSGLPDERLLAFLDRWVSRLDRFFPELIHPDALRSPAASRPVNVGPAPFTQSGDPRVEKLLAEDIRKGAERIVASLEGCRSLILTGGFSRGEGGVLIEGDRIQPVNDYDFVAVMDRDAPQKNLKDLRENLAADLAVHHVDILTMPWEGLRGLTPYQFNYDLKHGGRVLWGEDALKGIPDFRPEEIPLDSSKLVLVNRVICLLEGYSGEFESRAMTEDEAFYLANQTAKALLGCAEGVLIRAGKYHHLYSVRSLRFREEFPDFRELSCMIDWATRFKLHPVRRPVEDLRKIWRQAIAQYFTVLGTFPTIFENGKSREWRAGSRKEARSSLLDHLVREENSLHPIEKMEMHLLGCRVAGFWQRRKLLDRARKTLKDMTSHDSSHFTWEQLRKTAVKLWHENLG